jgi:hypothetical protein
MQKIIKIALYALPFLSLVAQATGFQALTQRCEESLALSALPETLRDRANVYVWRDGEFAKTISSAGGFHCIVQRNHPDSIIPECVTSTGEDSILQGIMVQTKLTASGLPADEVTARFEKMLAEGEIASPKAPGVNYMMSAYNRIYNSSSNSIANIGPHTMFFAPHASNAVVGGSLAMARDTHGFPFVVEAGTHSYIVTFTERSAEVADVLQHCSGQIDVSTAAVAAN